MLAFLLAGRVSEWMPGVQGMVLREIEQRGLFFSCLHAMSLTVG